MNYNDHPVVKEIRRLAAENPDHVDPNVARGIPCKYFQDGQPSCIIGHAAHNLYPGRFLDDYECKPGFLILSDLDPNNPYVVREWADYVQECQDAGKSWSEAVSLADETYPL